jgi:hypothetical protein
MSVSRVLPGCDSVNASTYAVVGLNFHPFGFAATHQVFQDAVYQVFLVNPHIAKAEEIVLKGPEFDDFS